MHELSIALSIVDAAVEEAVRLGDVGQGDLRVTAVHLKLGALSGVVREALDSAFEVARAGSPLEHAVLVVEEIPAAAYCPACAAERPVVSVQYLACSVCGNPAAQIVRGRELEVVALEVDERVTDGTPCGATPRQDSPASPAPR